MTQIGFIGLGHMGNPMAHNLLKAGHTVKVYDLLPSAIQALSAEGALVANSQFDAIKDADVIISMLQTGQQVSDLCLQPEGIFSKAKKNVLYIDSSSIDITVTKELHKKANKLNISMLDAPVSGGVAGAAAATLTFMVGGEESDYARALPILEKMGKKIVYAGAAGHGQIAKICNNLILGISMIAVSEGFVLAEKLGLDQKKFFEIASNATSQCWSMTSYCPVPGIVDKVPSNNNYKPGFMSKMMLKDLLLGLHAAEAVSATVPLGVAAAALYSTFVEQGNGEMDFSGIIQMISNKI